MSQERLTLWRPAYCSGLQLLTFTDMTFGYTPALGNDLKLIIQNTVTPAGDGAMAPKVQDAFHRVHRPAVIWRPAAAMGGRVPGNHGSRLVHAAVQHAAARLEGELWLCADAECSILN